MEHAQGVEELSLISKLRESYEGGHRPFYKSKLLVTILLAIIFLSMGYVFSDKSAITKPKPKGRKQTKPK